MKTPQNIIRLRVDDILLVRMQGGSPNDIRQFVAEREAAGKDHWAIPEGSEGISERTLWRYIARSEELMEEMCKETREQMLLRHRALRRFQYAKADAQGDVRAAIAVLADEAKLEGLYAPSKVALTNPAGDAPASFTIETVNEHGNIVPIPIPPKIAIAHGTNELPPEQGVI